MYSTKFHIKNEAGSQISNLSSYLKILEKEEEKKPRKPAEKRNIKEQKSVKLKIGK